ncbi:hypothetical protein [Pseudohalocynthiibacter sp. F2068]|jgi:hypothetical protein|uniref:hypothetical protein n=1 Tax=Pseudohalocynthiibacter sp. F2068 TaxID=2926418 RepID=UPI001FF61983|nr:hypothetical protein [Pseudohalocynthiibacter sp. F2068]MCK0104367.1 hypothetical protein [Pseudohalocynthiibacter sp. F2068]
MNWREHAEAGRWHHIDHWKLQVEELRELLAILKDVVPKREFGDGLLKFEDFARGSDVDGSNVSVAAWLLRDARERLYRLTRQKYHLSEVFRHELELSNDIFLREGFPKGIPDAVYWSETFQIWRPLYGEIGYKLRERYLSSYIITDEGVETYVHPGQHNKPWRNNLPINQYSKIICEPYSLIWCAIRLCNHINFARGEILYLSDGNNKRLGRVVGAYNLTALGMEIGRMAEMIRWKLQHEEKAIAGLEAERIKEAREKGAGKASAKKRLMRVEALLTCMENLVSANPVAIRFGPDALADLAIEDAAAENPSLWSQGKGQKDYYLSEMKTNSEFRNRYLAMFSR